MGEGNGFASVTVHFFYKEAPEYWTSWQCTLQVEIQVYDHDRCNRQDQKHKYSVRKKGLFVKCSMWPVQFVQQTPEDDILMMLSKF